MLIRKICIVRSTLKQEDQNAKLSLQENLQETSNDFQEFIASNTFFINNPIIGFKFPKNSKTRVEYDLKSILSLEFVNDIQKNIEGYDICSDYRFYLKMDSTKIWKLLSEIESMDKKLFATSNCDFCAVDFNYKIKKLKEKYSFENISWNISEIGTCHDELIKKVKVFDENYKALYLVNKNESFVYIKNVFEIKAKCRVCSNVYKEGDIIVKLNCLHCFCKNCIVKSVKMDPTCPICGISV